MPTAHTRYSFTFGELSEAAQVTAVEAIAAKLSGDWWGTDEIERISQTTVYKLGEVLKSPGWDTFGEGDFPGVAEVNLEGWDIERGDHVALKGNLTRENAPGLPWASGVASVSLTATRYGTTVVAEQDDLYFTCASCLQDAVWETSGYHEGDKHHTIDVSGGTANDDVSDFDHTPTFEGSPPDRELLCRTVEEAVQDAMRAALTAARAEAVYIGSEENAREYIENNEPTFNEDGTLF